MSLNLVYLGVRTILGIGLGLRRAGVTTPTTTDWRTLARGFALQTANPKALMFFVALLPQFIDPGRPVGLQILILAVTSVLIEFVVLAGYGYLAARAAAVAQKPGFVALTNRISGGMLVAAGAGLALNDQ
ncbi:MAG: LysE family translocator [Acidobacteria bacterium]|nr:LysE family translocator [Acidobacteriota bacterium]